MSLRWHIVTWIVSIYVPAWWNCKGRAYLSGAISDSFTDLTYNYDLWIYYVGGCACSKALVFLSLWSGLNIAVAVDIAELSYGCL